jgi:hypothetical protein
MFLKRLTSTQTDPYMDPRKVPKRQGFSAFPPLRQGRALLERRHLGQ